MGIHGALARTCPIPPDLAEQAAPGVHHVRRLREPVQEVEFRCREMDVAALERDDPRRGVDHERAQADRVVGRRRPVGAAQERPHACHELPWAERLRHVVVGAYAEPDLQVGLRVACREHEDGDLPVALDAPAHLEPVDSGKHEVEHDEVRAVGAAEVDRLETVACDLDVEALGAEAGGYRRGDRCLVLHHGDTAARHVPHRRPVSWRAGAEHVEIPCRTNDCHGDRLKSVPIAVSIPP